MISKKQFYRLYEIEKIIDEKRDSLSVVDFEQAKKTMKEIYDYKDGACAYSLVGKYMNSDIFMQGKKSFADILKLIIQGRNSIINS